MYTIVHIEFAIYTISIQRVIYFCVVKQHYFYMKVGKFIEKIEIAIFHQQFESTDITISCVDK